MENIEKETLINKWNPHFQDTAKGGWVDTVPREKYLARLWEAMELRHVIVLTGVRRSGKSTLMQQLIGKLIEEKTDPKNALYLHLEDVLVRPYLKLGWKLLEELYTYYLEKYNPQGKVCVFLDEIQSVSEFNRWIYSHYERQENVKFIIAGSRQSLIESEASTLLTGRTVRFDIYPFNFYEYLATKNVNVGKGNTVEELRNSNFSQTTSILHHLGNFLNEGGYPEIVLAQKERNKELIANTYYRDILTRDIINPHEIRNPNEIESLGLQVLVDFTKTHTYRSLGKPQKLSVKTVKAYLDYFYKAYLFFESSHFSYKTKETQDVQKPKKIYVVDNGMRNFNVVVPRRDLGQRAENVVFLELMKNHPAVYYWKKKKEVDFVVMDPKMKPTLALYNVSYTDKLHEREVKGLVEGLKEFNLDSGTILTKNYFDKKEKDKKTVEFIPLWAWLIANGKVFFKENL
jgi:predicted AAA+ superfamily ATPase